MENCSNPLQNRLWVCIPHAISCLFSGPQVAFHYVDRNTCNMDRHALQIVLLAFLLAAAVPCAASEASGSEPEPDFTVTISRDGITENSQREFSLGPSATLRVVDETGKATLLPAPSTDAASEAGQYSVAYVFENGQCNFEKTVAYKDAFPGYSEELWVRTGTEAGTEKESAGEVGNYTFTNPPDEYLSGGVSFCVRFTTGTTTTTPSPTTVEASDDSPTHTDSSSNPTPGVGGQPPTHLTGDGDGEQGQGPEGAGEDQVTDSVDDGKSAGTKDNRASPVVSAGEPASPKEQTAPLESESAGPASVSLSTGDTPPKQEPTQDDAATTSPPSADSAVSLATAAPSSTQADEPTIEPSTSVVGNAENRAADGDSHARLRRLSGTEASEVKYLTIVVHSAASGSTAGTLTLSAALLALTASLLAIF
ncbi:unnamed protein product [Neospora caninum Liverpool]|uniref:Toxoplasma gondii family A protein n=1 Tax=Neospora caninum (strain Liverpool) TaxID=572307 RepID=F0VE62_NEOCL|nr:uncharacterized protein NCLIV_017951 [Neospora caninum Liverpool]CBZ52006.1 unnamed protein product [Neospora caninum Liverpool]CEL65967.1 TPA: hypothetical protein BN1204_017951 [Neospora caninum Liverpool]|eukprot:XP_003882038.1 uncharacterized protein NCLIV_017951 [Neospora caninum Liverpool]